LVLSLGHTHSKAVTLKVKRETETKALPAEYEADLIGAVMAAFELKLPDNYQ
jgi:hypothetical protein